MVWWKRAHNLSGYVDYDGRTLRLALLRRGTVSAAAELEVDRGRWASEASRGLRDLAADMPVRELVVVLGRAVVSLHELQLPKVPEEELPGLARFEACRELGLNPEEAALDYCVSRVGDDSLGVLVVTAPAELWDAIRDLAKRLGARLRFVGLRPLVVAQLAQVVAQSWAAGAPYFVCVPGRGTLEYVVMDDRPVLVRGLQSEQGLERELRRALVVAEERLNGRRPEGIVLPSPAPQQDTVAGAADALSLRLFTFDPFARAKLSEEAAEVVGPHGGTWAALAAVLQAGDAWGFVNLAEPKRPTEGRRLPARSVLLAGAAGVAAVTLLGLWSYQQQRALDQQIALYEQQLEQLQKFLEAARPVSQRYEAVERWLGAEGQPSILQLLERLVEQLPDRQDLYLQSLVLRREEGGGITIVIEGHARSPRAVARLHARLNNGEVFRARPRGGVQRLPRRDDYPWHFETEVVVQAEALEQSPAGEANES